MAQKVKIALLPCPCCGGSAEYTETSLPDAYSDHEIIACTECHLQMDNASPQEWNRRVQSAQQSVHPMIHIVILSDEIDIITDVVVFDNLKQAEKLVHELSAKYGKEHVQRVTARLNEVPAFWGIDCMKAAQQNAHLKGGGLCAKCGSPSWAHGAIGHDFIPPHPQVA